MPPSQPQPDGLPPETAFALLGNDTRVGIMRALWDAFESGRGENALSFSQLFEAVDIDDSGNFSYHLEKLVGAFVRRTDGGYELKQTGINVVRAVVAGAVTEDPAFGPTTVDVDCPLCGAPVAITYADEFMNVTCTACRGWTRWRGEPGHLFGALVPPVAVEGRPAEAAFRAAVAHSLHEKAAFNDDVCPHCSTSPETTVDLCADHDPREDGICPNCGRRDLALVWMVCSTCKRSMPAPTRLVILDRPVVRAFLHGHGVAHRFATWKTVARSFEVREELVAADPLGIRAAVPAGDDELRLTIDGELNVREVAP